MTETDAHRATTTCGLAGCQVPVIRRVGGGRPRLYCSDAHRAEARRRRLAGGGGPTISPAGTPLDEVRGLLGEALRRLDTAASTPRDDAAVAALRVEATAEVLRAQQAAADATRRAAASEERLLRERAEWQTTLGSLATDRVRQERAIDELSGALEGVRAELEQELVRHHRDLERAEALLHAERAARAVELEQTAVEAAELQQRLEVALGSAEHAERRAADAMATASAQAASVLKLELRAARADEQAHHAMRRAGELRAELGQARRDLVEERRDHRAVLEELRRRGATPEPGRQRQRSPASAQSGPASSPAVRVSRTGGRRPIR